MGTKVDDDEDDNRMDVFRRMKSRKELKEDLSLEQCLQLKVLDCGLPWWDLHERVKPGREYTCLDRKCPS